MPNKTILCVDDSVTMQKVAAITFAATEYEYVGARTADEGLSAAKNNKPALVLADAVMPGKTGYDLCKAIKADPELAGIPVLMMCGNSQAYDPARGSAAGADGHVTKPWDTQVMLDKVAEILGGSADEAAQPAPAARPAPPAAPSAAKPAPPPSPAAPAPPKPVAPPPPVTTPKPAPPPAASAKPATPNPQAQPGKPPVTPGSLARNDANAPEPPRSATIMGMPSLKLPPTQPASPEFSPPAEPQRQPEPARTRQEKPTSPRPISSPPSTPAAAPPSTPAAAPPSTPAAAPPAPTPTPAPSRTPAPAPSRTPAPAPAAATGPAGMRPPMISGTPTRRPDIAALQASASGPAAAAPAPTPAPTPAPQPPRGFEAAMDTAHKATTAAAESAAREAGLDPAGPEMAALVKLSREVIERVVWEVVPDLAETIIRENVDRLAKNGTPSQR